MHLLPSASVLLSSLALVLSTAWVGCSCAQSGPIPERTNVRAEHRDPTLRPEDVRQRGVALLVWSELPDGEERVARALLEAGVSSVQVTEATAAAARLSEQGDAVDALLHGCYMARSPEPALTGRIRQPVSERLGVGYLLLYRISRPFRDRGTHRMSTSQYDHVFGSKDKREWELVGKDSETTRYTTLTMYHRLWLVRLDDARIVHSLWLEGVTGGVRIVEHWYFNVLPLRGVPFITFEKTPHAITPSVRWGQDMLFAAAMRSMLGPPPDSPEPPPDTTVLRSADGP